LSNKSWTAPADGKKFEDNIDSLEDCVALCKATTDPKACVAVTYKPGKFNRCFLRFCVGDEQESAGVTSVRMCCSDESCSSAKDTCEAPGPKGAEFTFESTDIDCSGLKKKKLKNCFKSASFSLTLDGEKVIEKKKDIKKNFALFSGTPDGENKPEKIKKGKFKYTKKTGRYSIGIKKLKKTTTYFVRYTRDKKDYDSPTFTIKV